VCKLWYDNSKYCFYGVKNMTTAQQQQAAKKFAEYLKTDEAKAIFEKHGFALAK